MEGCPVIGSLVEGSLTRTTSSAGNHQVIHANTCRKLCLFGCNGQDFSAYQSVASSSWLHVSEHRVTGHVAELHSQSATGSADVTLLAGRCGCMATSLAN